MRGRDVKTTRVLLVGLPRITRDMVRDALEARSDVEIVGETEEDGLADSVGRLRPDVVIIGAEEPALPPAATALLDERALRVLAITMRAGTGVLAELVPRQAALGQLSGESLVRVLADAAA
jgi:chemotaxis response regulator CheB